MLFVFLFRMIDYTCVPQKRDLAISKGTWWEVSLEIGKFRTSSSCLCFKRDIHPTKTVQMVVMMMLTLNWFFCLLTWWWPWIFPLLIFKLGLEQKKNWFDQIGVRVCTGVARRWLSVMHRWDLAIIGGGKWLGMFAWPMVVWDKYTPVKEHSTWKWMFGILVSFWETLFSGAMLVLERVGVSPPHENEDVPPKKGNTFSGNVYLFQPLSLRECRSERVQWYFRWGKFNPKIKFGQELRFSWKLVSSFFLVVKMNIFFCVCRSHQQSAT